jgi:hypothetical protein
MTTTTIQPQQQPEDSDDDSNMMMRVVDVDDDDDYVYETHVVGRLPFSRQEPIEPEIIFSTDKLWQDDQSDVDMESILGADSEDEVIFSDAELEETSSSSSPNNGACCECKLPRSNERSLESTDNTITKQQTTPEASTASSEGQSGDGDLFQFR